MATVTKKGSMRDVLSATDPTTQGGSLSGTMTPAASATPAATTPAVPADQAQPQTAQQKNVFEEMDQHEPLSEEEWYQLLHNLGSAMQRANPDIQKVIQQMSPEIDYGKQAEELRQRIQARPVAQAPGFFQSMMGRAGTPEAAAQIEERTKLAHGQAAQKQKDLEDLQENITMGHIGDLQRRGKYQEALATLLLQKGLTASAEKSKQASMLERERLKGQNAVATVRERAAKLADTFHFDERMRLKLLDAASKVAQAKLSKYGGLDPVTGGFTIKPDQYSDWQDETMGEIYKLAAGLSHGATPETPTETPSAKPAAKPAGKTPSTSQGKAKPDALGIR